MTHLSKYVVALLFLAGLAVVESISLSNRTPRVSDQAVPKTTFSNERFLGSKAASYGRLPLAFEPNQGQSHSPVKFLARGSGYSIYLEPAQATLALRAANLRPSSSAKELDAKPAIFRIAVVGADGDARITGTSQLPGKVNYLLGNDSSRWLTDIPTFARVEYQSVYPNVDMVYYGNQGSLEYDFVVRPGANPQTIRLKYPSVSGMRLTSHGDLLLNVAGREVRQQAPFIYQEDGNGRRKNVRGHYVVYAGNQIGFSVADYDRKRALIIDPTLVYSGILGGSGSEIINAIAIDSNGNAYLTGLANTADFPTTVGAFQTVFPSVPSVTVPFVSKLNPSGTALVYSTFLDGTTFGGLSVPRDFGSSIAVDSFGNAIVGGHTSATNFPTTAGSIQPGPSGCANSNAATLCDGFVAKLNATGSAVLYATYLGGTGEDVVNGVAADANGIIYATGTTLSSDYPTTPSALKTTFNAGGPRFFVPNGFVTKIDPSKSGAAGFVYSTYLGGTSGNGGAIAVDSVGAAYVTGTSSGDFPVTPGAIQSNGGPTHPVIYAAKLNPVGSALTYGADFDDANGQFGTGAGIAIDADGNAYITGTTGNPAFPVTPGAFQTSFVGTSSIFVTKLNSTGSALVYSTFLDGAGPSPQSLPEIDRSAAIAVDSARNAYVTGFTHDNDFPISAVTLNPMCGHNDTCFSSVVGKPPVTNAFASELNPTGSGLVFSTFLGGSDTIQFVGVTDEGRGIAADGTGNIYVVGATRSCDFPTTPGAISDPHSPPCRHGFVSKISVSALGPAVALLPGTATFRPEAAGTPAPQLTAVLTNRGNDNLSINNIVFNGATFTESNNCPGTLAPAANCTFTFGFTPPTIGNFNGQLVVTDNAVGSPHIVNVVGSGGTPAVSLSGTSLNFPNQVVNSPSAPQSITMKNIGNADLQITSVAASGDFAQTNNCGTSLGFGATCAVNVTFTPTTTGSRNGSVTITDNASTSPQTILLGGTGTDFMLTPTSSSATVSAGQTATYTVNITPNGSLSQTTTVACSGAPAGANCSANPNSIPPGSATAPVNVSVSTTAPSASAPIAKRFPPGLLPGLGTLLMVLVVCLVWAIRSKKSALAAGTAFAMFLLLCAIAGCGGGGSGVHGGGTPPGTYTLTVTATSGSASRSTTLNLIVK